jgi:ribonuclease P protein component
VGRHFVLWVLPNELGHFRAGAVASKRVGNAVKRNRAKRRIRELVRTHQHQFSPGQDLVFVSRYTVPDAEWSQLLKDFEHVCTRAGVYNVECEESRG